MNTNFRIIAGAAALSLASLAHAASTNFSGELTALDPTFNRPVSLGALSAVGTAVSYDVFPFFVTGVAGPTSFTLDVAAFNSVDQDSFLALYQNGFSAAAPLTNLLAINDDGPVALLSQIVTPLSPGVQYFMVMTTFDNNVFGTYNGTISAAGNATAVFGVVPEPGTYALMGLGLAGLLVAARRRKAS